jgi:hypothetical protein
MAATETPSAGRHTSHRIPNSLGFPSRQTVIETAERCAALSGATGSERFGMVIAPGVRRLVTGEWALDVGVTYTTRTQLGPSPNRIAISSPPPEREPITGWSRKSRAVIRVFAELDYSPLIVTEDLPAMITLTYLGDWLTVAPNAAAVKRVHFKALAKRWQRVWRSPPAAYGNWSSNVVELRTTGPQSEHRHDLGDTIRRGVGRARTEAARCWHGSAGGQIGRSDRHRSTCRYPHQAGDGLAKEGGPVHSSRDCPKSAHASA